MQRCSTGVLYHRHILPSSHWLRCAIWEWACSCTLSFDFAQQVHYPHNPLQPGPMYFKTARKCAIFGVCCEGFPRQVNYLIDEASNTEKGANTVISLLHHFLAHHTLGEHELSLHADNCSGQNKNNMVLQVRLLWCIKGC